jgi:hypothetical protein
MFVEHLWTGHAVYVENSVSGRRSPLTLDWI